MDNITRMCRKCGQEKPLSEFVKNKTCALGYSHTCKQCNAERNRKWRAANPEKVREYNRKWREILSDGYLRYKLKQLNLPVTPETIDYKRIQLKLYREIKKQQNDERD
jgi:hypothetical protein